MRGRRALLCSLAAVVIAGIAAAVASAAWTSTPTAAQSISSRTLTAPASLTATALAHNVQLSWPAGSGGSGYAIQAVANGLSSDCSGASFTALTTTSSTSATDTGRYTPQGSWECYLVKTTYGTWSSTVSNPVAAVQLGFVAASVVSQNGGTANVLDAGDSIVLTFNQPVKTTTGPTSSTTVCITAGTSATLVLGSTTTSGTCAASETTKLGTVPGLTSSSAARWNATYVWATGNQTLTVTLGSRSQGGSNPTVTGVSGVSFDPTNSSTALQSNTGSFHICDTNTTGSDCLPDVTGSI